MTGLRAGWATVDITPAVGIRMGGYLGRTSDAVEVADRLSARAIVFRDEQGAKSGGGSVALISLDLIGLAAEVVAEIRSCITSLTELEPSSVMVCCTHTHAGPLTFPFRGMGDIDAVYLSGVVESAAGAVAEAGQRLQPVTLSYSRVEEVRIAVNRRETRNGRVVIGHNPDGPVCDHVHVVRADCGQRSCILFSYPCHPSVLGPSNNALSADFPGAAVAHVESETGAMALFVNGACGDINPRTKGGFEGVSALGAELGKAVVSGAESAQPLPGVEIVSVSSSLQLPLVDPPARSQLALEKLVLKSKMGLVKLAGRDVRSQLAMQGQLDWAEDMLAVVRDPDRSPTQRFEVQAIRVGSMALLGMEGEMFVRYQLQLEEAEEWQPLILCGYANGCIGYVPTADEYARGGYEVGSGSYNFKVTAGVEAYKVYPSVQMIAPSCESVITEGVSRLLKELSQ